LRPFEYVSVSNAEEAVNALAAAAPNGKPVAGCTDLLVEIKHEASAAETLVDVSQLEELRGIELTDEGLRIGASVTHTEIMDSDLVAELAPALQDAAHTIGAVQTRTLGTLAGNLVTCVPSMDSGPTLMALEATVNILGSNGARSSSLEDLFVFVRKTSLEPDEIITDIVVPKKNLGKPTVFHKFGLRKGQALALVNAAGSLHVKDGKMTDVRISLGAVAPVVIRCLKAEAHLEGKSADDAQAINEAAEIALSETAPIDDFRASKAYRNELIKVLTKRCVEQSIAIANGQ
jgi:CO/xanthine dehydrogenase FAD-binding subunit